MCVKPITPQLIRNMLPLHLFRRGQIRCKTIQRNVNHTRTLVQRMSQKQTTPGDVWSTTLLLKRRPRTSPWIDSNTCHRRTHTHMQTHRQSYGTTTRPARAHCPRLGLRQCSCRDHALSGVSKNIEAPLAHHISWSHIETSGPLCVCLGGPRTKRLAPSAATELANRTPTGGRTSLGCPQMRKSHHPPRTGLWTSTPPSGRYACWRFA